MNHIRPIYSSMGLFSIIVSLLMILMSVINFISDIWQRMLDHVPPHTRFLAFSTRGYAPSSPLDAASTPLQIQAQLGHDLAAVISNFITQLSLLAHPESKVKLLVWSMGFGSFLSTYQLLGSFRLALDSDMTMRGRINEVIIFEIPPTMVLGAPPSADMQSYNKNIENKSSAEIFQIGMQRVTGFYNLPDSVFTDLQRGVANTEIVPPAEKFSSDDPEFMRFVGSSMDPGPIVSYTAAALHGEKGDAYSKAALNSLMKSGVKKVTVLTTRKTMADCLGGNALCYGMLRDLRKDMGDDWHSPQVESRLIEGEYNHFIHVHDPKALWDSIV